jgi:hypothetical protein
MKTIDLGSVDRRLTSLAILGFGVLVVTSRNTVHCILFLVADFLCIAALYVLQGAQFLAVIQVVVYAGGIVVLYLFVVMLVDLKRPGEVHQDRRRRGRGMGAGHAPDGARIGPAAGVDRSRRHPRDHPALPRPPPRRVASPASWTGSRRDRKSVV